MAHDRGPTGSEQRKPMLIEDCVRTVELGRRLISARGQGRTRLSWCVCIDFSIAGLAGSGATVKSTPPQNSDFAAIDSPAPAAPTFPFISTRAADLLARSRIHLESYLALRGQSGERGDRDECRPDPAARRGLAAVERFRGAWPRRTPSAQGGLRHHALSKADPMRGARRITAALRFCGCGIVQGGPRERLLPRRNRPVPEL